MAVTALILFRFENRLFCLVLKIGYIYLALSVQKYITVFIPFCQTNLTLKAPLYVHEDSMLAPLCHLV